MKAETQVKGMRELKGDPEQHKLRAHFEARCEALESVYARTAAFLRAIPVESVDAIQHQKDLTDTALDRVRRSKVQYENLTAPGVDYTGTEIPPWEPFGVGERLMRLPPELVHAQAHLCRNLNTLQNMMQCVLPAPQAEMFGLMIKAGRMSLARTLKRITRVREQPRRAVQNGFTLIEIIVVLAVTAAVSLWTISMTMGWMRTQKARVLESQMRAVEDGLTRYTHVRGGLPAALQDIEQPVDYMRASGVNLAEYRYNLLTPYYAELYPSPELTSAFPEITPHIVAPLLQIASSVSVPTFTVTIDPSTLNHQYAGSATAVTTALTPDASGMTSSPLTYSQGTVAHFSAPQYSWFGASSERRSFWFWWVNGSNRGGDYSDLVLTVTGSYTVEAVYGY